MKTWFLLCLALAFALAFVHGSDTATAQSTPADSAAQAWAAISVENHKDAEEVRARIKDVAEAPDDSVFKNIKIQKGITASHLVNAMEFGYARALGVRCTHCHVAGKFDSEDKPQKQIARDMMLMQKAINDSLLAKIPNLKSAKPVVNCTTCHRGQVKPATNMS
jgi:hypothetical protein